MRTITFVIIAFLGLTSQVAAACNDYKCKKRDEAHFQSILAFYREEPASFLFWSQERDRYDLLLMQTHLNSPRGMETAQQQSLILQKQEWIAKRTRRGMFVPKNSVTVYLEQMLEAEGLSSLGAPDVAGKPLRYLNPPAL